MYDWTKWVLIGFIALLVIAYPILVSSRNKKENQKLQEQTNSLKRGDKVLTTSGVYGTVVDLQMDENKKIVTIETGSGNHKSYMAFDAYAIYTVFHDEDKKLKENNQEKSDKPAQQKKSNKDDKNKEKTAKIDEKEQKNDQKSQSDDKKLASNVVVTEVNKSEKSEKENKKKA